MKSDPLSVPRLSSRGVCAAYVRPSRRVLYSSDLEAIRAEIADRVCMLPSRDDAEYQARVAYRLARVLPEFPF